MDKDRQLGGIVISTPLGGSGTYTFQKIVISPSRSGVWHLVVGVTDHPETRIDMEIKVLE